MLLNYGVGADAWESLDCKEIKAVNPKGDQLWIFIAKMDAKALIQMTTLSTTVGKNPLEEME